MDERKEKAHEKEDAIKEDAETEEKEIDIYLFSNGQQYSPPRKYHLRVDELKYWDATLGSLARSQYGSLHSAIELHELDGRKVEDASSIRDCAVYVAVVPPDTFIYAGYDKYLVKASKSIERRFSKRLSQDSANPDETGKDSVNVPTNNQHTPVITNEVRPQYPNPRKNNDVRKSSIKNSSQKVTTEDTKPVSNQVSQRRNVPHTLSLNPSDVEAKKIYSSKRETPKHSSRLSSIRKTRGRTSTLDSSLGLQNRLSPLKHSCFNFPKEDDTYKKPLNTVADVDASTVKIQNSINKENTSALQKSSNINTKKLDSADTKDSFINVPSKKITYHSNNALIKRLKVSSLKKEQMAAMNEAQNSQVNNKVQIPVTIRKSSPVAPSQQVSILNRSRASMADTLDRSTKDENYANNRSSAKTDISNRYKIKKAIADEILKSPNKDSFSVISESKEFITEEIPVEDMNRGISETNNMSSGTIVLADKSKQTEYLENLLSCDNATKIQIFKTNPEHAAEFYNKDQPIKLKPDQQNKANYTAITLAQENHEENSTNLQRKSSEKEIGKLTDEMKNFLIIMTRQLVRDQSLETFKIDPITLTNKNKESTVTTIPNIPYISVVTENESNNMKITLQNSSVKSSTYTKEVFEIKESLLNHVPERTVEHKSNIGDTRETNDNNNDTSLLLNKIAGLGDSVEITIKSEDSDTAKNLSYVINVSKDNNLTLKNFNAYQRSEIQETGNIPVTSLIKDKDILHMNIYRNPECNVTSSHVSINSTGHGKNANSDILSATDPKDRHNSRSNLFPELLTTFVNSKQDGQSTGIAAKSPSTSKIVSNAEHDTNKTIALMQTCKTINCNTDEITKITEHNNIDIRKTISITQFTNDEINKTPNELTRSKSLQSVENDDPPHPCCQKPKKFVVYQCACCGENANHNLGANLLNPALQGFYVLLPVIAQPANESVKPPSQISDKSVQHTISLTKVNIVTVVNENPASVPGDGDNVTADNSADRVECCSKRQISIIGNEIFNSEMIVVNTDTPQASSPINTESKRQQTNSKTQNQATQTDWCDVLLEARAEPDGHYTFYLPPLQVLQEYSLR